MPATLADRAHLAINLHVSLVDVPAPGREIPHATDVLATDVRSEHGTEPVPTEPHGFVAQLDAAFERQIFRIPQR
jgi:hypothetical protein